ncbi:MAG: hypothetical protein GY783_07815 [Gammaproteobacteria bacterium]|nr:hypothetical protein [Gammaproteobacteria bacterium]
MKHALILIVCLPQLLGAACVSAGQESLSQYARRAHTFIWDRGSEPYVADPDDMFFDWTTPCDIYVPTVPYEQANSARCAECQLEMDRIHSLLNAYQLNEEIFNGSLLRARLGNRGSPLFVLAPSPHPETWIATSGASTRHGRSRDLHISNILDFLNIVDVARAKQQSVSNVSETMNLLLGGRYLQRTRQTISETMRRDSYLSDEDWVHAVLSTGLVDASTFLAIAFEDSEKLKHLPIEPQSSYINSALLTAVLALRHRMDVVADQTLHDAFSAEYELGLAYSGYLEHRFSGSALMDRFRKSWRLFKRFSQLPEGPLLRTVSSNCEQRSQDMISQLAELVRTKRTDYYLVTLGPLHLHGVLRELETNRFSYLIIAPSPLRSFISE